MEKNKDHIKEHVKEYGIGYREKNKEIIINIKKLEYEKFITHDDYNNNCICGGKYIKNHKLRHMKSF